MNKSIRDLMIEDHTKPLFDTLSRMPGIKPIDSEWGFTYESDGRGEIDSYSVRFAVEHSEVGWHSLAFLAWLVNSWLHNESVALLATAPPPYQSGMTDRVVFEWQGTNGHDPKHVAHILTSASLEYMNL